MAGAMRLLANENIPAQTIAALQHPGHDVAWVRTEAPGSRDEDVLARALSEERILITFDKDFGELAFRAHLPPATGIVLLRISAPSPDAMSLAIVSALSRRTDWVGHFSVIEDDRVRMTALPKPVRPSRATD
jgi:predicted nuclease of predicted toxin-antitoxin system